MQPVLVIKSAILVSYTFYSMLPVCKANTQSLSLWLLSPFNICCKVRWHRKSSGCVLSHLQIYHQAGSRMSPTRVRSSMSSEYSLVCVCECVWCVYMCARVSLTNGRVVELVWSPHLLMVTHGSGHPGHWVGVC